jgi:glycosyltransferase involved in cell wall biosynthesis
VISILAVHHGGGVGGAPVSMLDLLAALDGAQFGPSAVFTEPGPIQPFAKQRGVPTRVVRTGGAFFYSAHARLDPRTLARFVRTFPSAVQVARRTLRDLQPDLVHLNTSVLLAWAAAARREGVPIVWHVREVLGPNPVVRRWQAGFLTRHARVIVAISEAVRTCLPTARLVYNAVDLRQFDLALERQAADVRRELGIREGEKAVMMLGSVQRAKGHWLALDALTRVEPPARLVLVCGGVPADYPRSVRGRVKAVLGMPMDNLDALLRDAERAGVAERITVTGFRSDIARVLAAADVLLFPSLLPEGFGRPIIEAMAMARPVVATDVGPSRELLDAAGVLVAPTADAVAGAVRVLLADADHARQLGCLGRARVQERFTLDRQVAAMQEIYREAAASA